MRKYIKFLVIPFVLSMPQIAIGEEPQWLEGVFVNQDKTSLVKDVIFCPAGKVILGFIKAAYIVEGKDDNRVITLYSNGAFNMKVSDNGNELLPKDEFTKKWVTSSGLKLDPSQEYECKPQF